MSDIQLRVAHEALLTHWERAKTQIKEDEELLKVRQRLEYPANQWAKAKPEQKSGWTIPSGIQLTEAEALLNAWGNDIDPQIRQYINASKPKAKTTNLWIFRITRDPLGVHFVMEQLSKYKKIRQGWGAPGLNLKLDQQTWMTNYRRAAQKYWRGTPERGEPEQRRAILMGLLNMHIGDIVFMPNVGVKKGSYLIDNNNFTMATVSEEYMFEDMVENYKPTRDFGHIIGISTIKTYAFSDDTLPKDIFNSQFMHCIELIEEHFAVFEKFRLFAINNGYQLNLRQC